MMASSKYRGVVVAGVVEVVLIRSLNDPLEGQVNDALVSWSKVVKFEREAEPYSVVPSDTTNARDPEVAL
jgi:hypothetical protein